MIGRSLYESLSLYTVPTMPYNSLTIKNFKGIAEIRLEEFGLINAIVGKNNVGKSTILEAIDFALFAKGLSESFSARHWTMPLHKRIQSYLYGKSTEGIYLFHQALPNSEPLRIQLDTDITLQLKALDTLEELPEYIQESEETFSVETPYEVQSMGRKGFLDLSPRSRLNRPSMFLSSHEEAHVFMSARKSLPDTRKSLTDKGYFRAYQEAFQKKLSDSIVMLLQTLEPNLENVYPFDENILMCDLKYHTRLLPDTLMGDGFRHLLSIASFLVSARGRVVLWDELETGLHWSIQPKLWGLIEQEAREHGTQFFITTHSYDLLQALADTIETMPEESQNFTKLFHVKTFDSIGRLTFRRYTGTGLMGLIHDGIELR
ncbi:MAG: AAA family ATPase [Vampirovibrionales bacterium]